MTIQGLVYPAVRASLEVGRIAWSIRDIHDQAGTHLRYRLPTRTSNNWLKSALAVSMNTPRLPPMATVHSPPEYAQPYWGTQFIPLSCVNEPARVLNIIVTVAQNWAVICAISSDMSIFAL
jgi:hypothetical protein